MMSTIVRHSGFSLIEVLVTIIIVAVGLLGLAGLQARFLSSEMESYQRSQALSLVQEMAGRISANRAETVGLSGTSPYVTGTTSGYLGTGDSPAASCSTLASQSLRDKCEWSKALQGAAEVKSTSEKIGAMIGARGCIEQISTNPLTYRVSVTWEGQSATKAPGWTCGAGGYGTDNRYQRLISLNVIAPKLAN